MVGKSGHIGLKEQVLILLVALYFKVALVIICSDFLISYNDNTAIFKKSGMCKISG